MADTGKIAKNLERFAQAVAAHDRENPTHTAYGIGLAHFDMERLGLRGGRGDPARHHDPRRRRRDGQLPRALRRRARRGPSEAEERGRRGDRHAGDPASLRRGARPFESSLRRAGSARAAPRVRGRRRRRAAARAAIIATSRSIVGHAMPWRAAARSTDPGIASSSGVAPGGDVALHRAAERGVRPLELGDRARRVDVAGALGLRRPRRPPRSRPRARRAAAGVERISPSSLS